jgi:single-strand DNA-binding protein
MSNDINNVILNGRLVRDPETKVLKNGTTVCNFSIANGRTYKVGEEKKEYTNFFNVQAFGKFAETIATYCTKGQQLSIVGRLQYRTWEKDGQKRSAIDIVLENFQFLAKPNGGVQAKNEPAVISFDDPSLIPPGDDVPF